jgi:hypothetical protein
MAWMTPTDAGFIGAFAGAFVAEMLRKGVWEVLAFRAWNQTAGAAMDCLPALYEITDELMPEWISSGADLEDRARRRYQEVFGVELPDDVIATWRAQYDPQRGADRFHHPHETEA